MAEFKGNVFCDVCGTKIENFWKSCPACGVRRNQSLFWYARIWWIGCAIAAVLILIVRALMGEW